MSFRSWLLHSTCNFLTGLPWIGPRPPINPVPARLHLLHLPTITPLPPLSDPYTPAHRPSRPILPHHRTNNPILPRTSPRRTRCTPSNHKHGRPPLSLPRLSISLNYRRTRINRSFIRVSNSRRRISRRGRLRTNRWSWRRQRVGVCRRLPWTIKGNGDVQTLDHKATIIVRAITTMGRLISWLSLLPNTTLTSNNPSLITNINADFPTVLRQRVCECLDPLRNPPCPLRSSSYPLQARCRPPAHLPPAPIITALRALTRPSSPSELVQKLR